MDQQPTFYVKHSSQVREFYTVLPKYVANYTDFNCGHMATHYAAAKQKGDEIHMYGFDSILDFNMRSVTDLILSSDRGDTNNYRLLNNWRPVWRDIFREFPKTKFVLHHNHDNLKIPKLDNVEVMVYNDKISSTQTRKDTSDISDGRGMEVPISTEPLNRKQRRAQAAQERKK